MSSTVSFASVACFKVQATVVFTDAGIQDAAAQLKHAANTFAVLTLPAAAAAARSVSQGQRREAEGIKGWEVGMPKVEVLTTNYR
jgi:hypothetical protein